MNRKERKSQRQKAVFGGGGMMVRRQYLERLRMAKFQQSLANQTRSKGHDPTVDTVDRTPITPLRSLVAAVILLSLGHFVWIMGFNIYFDYRDGVLGWTKIAITILPAVLYLYLIALTIRTLYRYIRSFIRFLLRLIFPTRFHDYPWTPEGIGTFAQESLMVFIGVLTPLSAALFVTNNWHIVPKSVIFILVVCGVVLILRLGKPIPRVIGKVLGRSEQGLSD